ncbi:MAG: pyridoxamine 5'-phosphate oxidase family protein [Verrucomicrobia bacterium]|nr:pyridoxamine 5'-phosphate oxidase family protein [Verrucomicrobiota bacterium]
MTLFAVKDFEIEKVLSRPLMAHLSTTSMGEPRDSPVWFIWEDSFLWIFGTDNDSFIKRLKKEPRCAVGVVDFDLEKGILLHVGIRGSAQLHSVDPERLRRFLSKYLGNDQDAWNPWFVKNIASPLNRMVQITPQSAVARDVSFFKSGPGKAS